MGRRSSSGLAGGTARGAGVWRQGMRRRRLDRPGRHQMNCARVTRLRCDPGDGPGQCPVDFEGGTVPLEGVQVIDQAAGEMFVADEVEIQLRRADIGQHGSSPQRPDVTDAAACFVSAVQARLGNVACELLTPNAQQSAGGATDVACTAAEHPSLGCVRAGRFA
jgi:hypothetical protein